MKIYTKNGDQGDTCLVDGQKVSKAHARLEAYGTLDELNASLGMSLSLIKNETRLPADISKEWQSWILEIQHLLFNLGSHWATEKELDYLPAFDTSKTKNLEMAIDKLDTVLPKLKNFILPGSTVLASSLHIARTITRRAERSAIHVDKNLVGIAYVNRLSDFFFVLARAANHYADEQDILWQPNQPEKQS